MLLPQSATKLNRFNTRSLSVLGIVCFLLLTGGVGAGRFDDAPAPKTLKDISGSVATSSPTTKPHLRSRPMTSAELDKGLRGPRRGDVTTRNAAGLYDDPERRDVAFTPTPQDESAGVMPTTDGRSHPARRTIPKLPPREPARTVPAEPVDYGTEDIVKSTDGDEAFRIRFKFPKDETRYLIIENDFKDRGGIPGLLTYTAESGSRITIAQRVKEAGVRVAGPSDLPRPDARDNEHETHLEWVVDRFEAREKALGEENTFDSLRDSYPVAPLRRLGTAADAKITFSLDGWTGETQRMRIQPGRMNGPATRRKLSKTTQKCLLDDGNVNQLLDDIGTLILPRVPKRVGDEWTRTRDKEIRNFGKSTTTYTMNLARVEKDADGGLVAEIQISGGIELVADPVPETPVEEPETQPSQPRRGRRKSRPQKRHEFKLDSASISGSIRFDITRGMLLEYTLRRDSSLSAEMKSEEMGDMSLVNAEAHTLRVKMLTTEPAKPIIVGGPKPPKDDPDDLRAPRRTAKRPTSRPSSTTAEERRARANEFAERRRKSREQIEKRRQEAMRSRGITTQPATARPSWPIPREVTTRPAPQGRKAPTTQPARPKNATTQPTADGSSKLAD